VRVESRRNRDLAPRGEIRRRKFLELFHAAKMARPPQPRNPPPRSFRDNRQPVSAKGGRAPSPEVRKRSRYSEGVAPIWARNERRIARAEPKPLLVAIESIVNRLPSMR